LDERFRNSEISWRSETIGFDFQNMNRIYPPASRTCKVDTLRSLKIYWEVWIEKERWVGKVDGKSNLAYSIQQLVRKIKKIKIKELICNKQPKF